MLRNCWLKRMRQTARPANRTTMPFWLWQSYARGLRHSGVPAGTTGRGRSAAGYRRSLRHHWRPRHKLR